MSIPTYASAINEHRLQYRLQSEIDQIRPFAIPADLLNYFVLIVCLLWPHRLPVASRVLVFTIVVALSLSSMQTARTLGLSYGVMVGISSSWCVTLSLNLLLINQPVSHFERMVACRRTPKPSGHHGNGVEEDEQWQGPPKSALERFLWVLDLLGSLRALHWSHRSHRDSISTDALKHRQESMSSPGRKIFKLLFLYLSVDGIKEVIAKDPYFWGYVDHDPPDYIKAFIPLASLIQAYRMLVGFAVFYIAIGFLSTVCMLIFVDMLGPSLAGTWGNQWAWRTPFGDIDSVCTRGLKGWWGAWWHQMFRIPLTSIASAIVHTLNLPKMSLLSKTLRLLIPFLLSGAVHASGSYTMWGETKPFDSFLFFLLQPVGIAIQLTGSWTLHRINVLGKVPPLVRKVTNVAFTAIWLLYTFPLLADDFARGGLWLTEPFPISIFQILGLGSKARAHQLWLGHGMHLYAGRRWWQAGLAM